MKIFFISFCFFFITASEAFTQSLAQWNAFKSTHFIVYYKHAQEQFINSLADKAEQYYNEIADDLGFRRYDFWLWDNRAKIYIYDSPSEYQFITGQPAWSGACTIAKIKVIMTFPNAQGFEESILPHELGHIIFREFVGTNNQSIPIWLDEGVAAHQEKIKYSSAGLVLKEAKQKGTFMNLNELSNFNPHSARNNNLIHLFYAESFSLVDFLIEEFGRDKFVYFCQNLRDKRNLQSALASSYQFNNIGELQDAWEKYLSERDL